MASRRPRLWTPLQVKRLSREMKAALDKLVPEYGEAHTYIHGRRDGHHQTDEERQQQAQVSAVRRIADPTGDIVAEQESNRKRLLQAAQKLEHAAQEIDAATALIKRVFSSPDDYYEPLESYRP